MTSSLTQHTDHLHVALSGDLIGGADAMKFAVTLREALAEAKVKRVEVDAAGVGFVNSSGLGMLIAARQAAMEHGAEFRLHQPSEQLQGLLNVTKLTDILGTTT